MDARLNSGQAGLSGLRLAWIAAIAVPLAYLFLYVPDGMDSTDFGYFYGYAWRILQGEFPYRDFHYIKPSLPLFWHAFWMAATPDGIEVLAGKAGFFAEMLAAAWFGALYLSRCFSLSRLGLPLPLLATAGFVFGIHCFPCMPWHTADGVFFASAGIFCASMNLALPAGLLCACSALCKQSFALVPIGCCIFLWLCFGRRSVLVCAAGWLAGMAAFSFAIWQAGAWGAFKAMTTGQLAIWEALDAGIGIYLHQNWWPLALCFVPWGLARLKGARTPEWLSPPLVFMAVVATWFLWLACTQKTWQGYGLSWPTTLVLAGGLMVFTPKTFTARYLACKNRPHPLLCASAALGLALLVSWSTAISGGYKIPAFFSTPLLFVLALWHAGLGHRAQTALWTALGLGLAMFSAGYHWPYTFPVRPLERAELAFDAGSVYPKAAGVRVDRLMLEKLEDLKLLRAKYGPVYKTLPGFTLAYYLNGDKPSCKSDWLIDWEINADCDAVYGDLVARKAVVFMERDQMDAEKADAYDRAGYTVPQRVRRQWRAVDETRHFVVFMPPAASATAPSPAPSPDPSPHDSQRPARP